MMPHIDRATTEEEVLQPFASAIIGLSGLVEPLKVFETNRIAVLILAEIEVILSG